MVLLSGWLLPRRLLRPSCIWKPSSEQSESGSAWSQAYLLSSLPPDLLVRGSSLVEILSYPSIQDSSFFAFKELIKTERKYLELKLTRGLSLKLEAMATIFLASLLDAFSFGFRNPYMQQAPTYDLLQFTGIKEIFWDTFLILVWDCASGSKSKMGKDFRSTSKSAFKRDGCSLKKSVFLLMTIFSYCTNGVNNIRISASVGAIIASSASMKAVVISKLM